MKKLKTTAAIICAALLIQALFQMPLVVQADILTPIQERLAEISQEEKEILQTLFDITQEIDEAQRQEEEIVKEVALLSEEIEDISNRLKLEEERYSNKRDILQEVLRGYQRRGAASYLHVIISSRSLRDLLKRLNIIREFTRGSGALLEELEESKERLQTEGAFLAERRTKLEALELELKDRIAENQLLRQELEISLTALGDEGKYFRENLQLLQKQWLELSLSLTGLRKTITNVIKTGNLSPDVLKITYGLFNARVAIDEKDFNTIFKANPDLSMLEFKLTADKVIMSVPEKGLELTGNFVVRTGNNLELLVAEGRFYDMPLKQEAIDELFKEGPIIIDLSPITEGNSIRSIGIFDGYLELLIVPRLL